MREFEQKKIANPSPSPFFGPKIQKKLTTGTVGDKYETEADNVADKVVNKRKTGGLLQSRSEEAVQQKPISETISTVQKQDLAQEQPLQKKGKEKEEDKKVQKKGEKEEDKKVQKKSDKEEDKKVQKKGEKEEDKKVQKKSDKEEDKKVQKKGEKEEDKKVQKKCADCESEDKKAQKKEEKKEEKKPVQAKLNESNSVNEGVESDLNSSKGGGSAMDKNTKQEMESGFGSDFSNVKIHTDASAVQMSQELGAQAFTNGNDVYFNEGKYNPASQEGKHLLAHELTHTVQQTGAKQKSGTIQKSSIENHPEDLQAGNNLNKIDSLVRPQATVALSNKLQKQKEKGGGNCCSGEYQLPQKDYAFNIDNSVMTSATFCSKGNFKISSNANWVKPHTEEHYHIRLTAIQGGTINKTTRRYNVGETETQSFTVNSKDCIFFKVEVEIINPKNSPNLKGSFNVTN